MRSISPVKEIIDYEQNDLHSLTIDWSNPNMQALNKKYQNALSNHKKGISFTSQNNSVKKQSQQAASRNIKPSNVYSSAQKSLLDSTVYRLMRGTPAKQHKGAPNHNRSTSSVSRVSLVPRSLSTSPTKETKETDHNNKESKSAQKKKYKRFVLEDLQRQNKELMAKFNEIVNPENTSLEEVLVLNKQFLNQN